MNKITDIIRPEIPKTLYRFISPSQEPEENVRKFWPDLENAIHRQRHYMASLSQQNDPFEARPSFIASKLKDVRGYLRRFEAVFGKDRSFTGTNIAAEFQLHGVAAKDYRGLVGHTLEAAKYVTREIHAGFPRVREATKPLPTGVGRIFDVVFEVLKYDVLRDCPVGGRKVSPAPKSLAPVPLFQLREFTLYFMGRSTLHLTHQIAN